jgi:putative lipase involved disintegration of autophagic bodies
MFPHANIWVIGHSLGGSLASLVGITFGVPVVTFEPPGERMAADRLHLPSPVRITSDTVSKLVKSYNRTSAAVYASHHARLAHRGSDCDGYL